LDAKRTLDRNQPLLEKKIIAQATMDTAQTNYDTAVAQRDVAKAQVESAKSQIESFKAQVEQAKAAVKVSETNLRYTTIRSPVNGTVISRNVDVGQTVAASLQAPTLFTIAKNLAEMQVDSNVSEADVGRVVVGQSATFTVDAYPERIFHGRVSEIRNAPIIVQNVVTYDVVILVENKDLKLKPGMTANVSVMIAHRDGALKVPNAALRFRPEFARKEGGKVGPSQKADERVKPVESDQGKAGRVWTLSPEGKPVPVSITVGISDGTSSEVIGGNLQEGAEVIIEGSSSKKAQNQTGSVPFMPRMRR
jgi:HlyD family secretion protein